MKSNPGHQPTNFWFGFALGSLSAAAAAYLFGTKQGRQQLKKLVELSEQVGDNSPDIVSSVKEIMQSFSDPMREEATPPSSTPLPQQENEAPSGSLNSVMDKIKSVSQPKGYVKKFFSKDED
jgi:hypothetical protein